MSEGQAQGEMPGESRKLVSRARTGEPAAFDELYQLHRDTVYTLCLNLCGDRDQAQDLLQETFFRAWRGLRGFRGKSAFTTWLHRITVNVCRDAERRRRARGVDVSASAESFADCDPTVEQVRATLTRLKKPYGTVLALRYTLSLSYDEIAQTLGWSLPKVKVTIHRAKAAFRKAYDVDGD